MNAPALYLAEKRVNLAAARLRSDVGDNGVRRMLLAECGKFVAAASLVEDLTDPEVVERLAILLMTVSVARRIAGQTVDVAVVKALGELEWEMDKRGVPR